MSNFLLGILPNLLEILVNGSFIAFYSLHKAGKNIFSLTPEFLDQLLPVAQLMVVGVLLYSLMSKLLTQRTFEEFLRRHVFSLIIFVPIVISYRDLEITYWLAIVHLFSTMMIPFEKHSDQERETGLFVQNKLKIGLLSHFKLSAAQIILVTWTGTILTGALLLILPISSSSRTSMHFIDALFLSTSATSTTGLSTVSLHDDLSFFGQFVVMILIQIGGIGFMTMSSAFLMISGKSLAIKEQVILQDILDATALSDLYDMTIDVLRYTFIIEFVGAVVLSYGFYDEGFEFGESLWQGCFHSVSAFCTAGFGLFNNSMEDFAKNSYISWGCTILAILGGLGFIVLKELTLVFQKKMRLGMISIHSKVILATSIGMYALGTAVVFNAEFLNSISEYGLYEKFHISLFQFAATMSTSGFNSIPINSLHSYTLYFLIITMFIGCSPGSTGGGIKITTFAILVQSVKTTLYGKNEVAFFNRSIDPSMVVKATALTIISLTIITISIYLMMAAEPGFNFLQLSFEVLSAFGTVGLSMGITSKLSVLGKVIITAVMYAGRIGPLTLVLALAESTKKQEDTNYPRGKIMIG